jgi:putative lipase involved disintegration of autophagic bodies
MQLFSADATMFLKNSIFFCPQKVEKNTIKRCSKKLKSTFFFLTASTAQMAQTEELMFQNVAYRPTVYRTGDQSSKAYAKSFPKSLPSDYTY